MMRPRGLSVVVAGLAALVVGLGAVPQAEAVPHTISFVQTGGSPVIPPPFAGSFEYDAMLNPPVGGQVGIGALTGLSISLGPTVAISAAHFTAIGQPFAALVNAGGFVTAFSGTGPGTSAFADPVFSSAGTQYIFEMRSNGIWLLDIDGSPQAGDPCTAVLQGCGGTYTITPHPVPEPGTLVLLLTGGAGGVLAQRLRRRSPQG